MRAKNSIKTHPLRYHNELVLRQQVDGGAAKSYFTLAFQL